MKLSQMTASQIEAPMSKAAAQIMNVKGENQTINSVNMASMSAAYSSVGELNSRKPHEVVDRFNSRGA